MVREEKDRIEVKVPRGMKQQLKKQFGRNLSKIMTEHFGEVLKKEKFKETCCFGCNKKENPYKLYGTHVSDKDSPYYLLLFCKECIDNIQKLSIDEHMTKFNEAKTKEDREWWSFATSIRQLIETTLIDPGVCISMLELTDAFPYEWEYKEGMIRYLGQEIPDLRAYFHKINKNR